MALKTKVKVGNITNLSDARYCAGMGVDWLGFGAGTIDQKTYEDITGWVTGPSFIIEMNSDTPLAMVNQYAADGLEIPFSRLSDLDQMHHATIMVSLPMTDWIAQKNQLIQRKAHVSVLIFTEGLNHAQTEDEVLAEASAHFEILIGFPFTLDRITDEMRHRVGFHLQGSNEVRPGLKDYQSLAEVLEQLDVEG